MVVEFGLCDYVTADLLAPRKCSSFVEEKASLISEGQII